MRVKLETVIIHGVTKARWEEACDHVVANNGRILSAAPTTFTPVDDGRLVATEFMLVWERTL